MDIAEKTFKKKADFVTREIAGETIIVPIRNNVGDLNAIYTLNELGTQIWQYIDGQTKVCKLIDKICSSYEVEAGQAEQDTMAFLEQLREAGLIHLNGER